MKGLCEMRDFKMLRELLHSFQSSDQAAVHHVVQVNVELDSALGVS